MDWRVHVKNINIDPKQKQNNTQEEEEVDKSEEKENQKKAKLIRLWPTLAWLNKCQVQLID